MKKNLLFCLPFLAAIFFWTAEAVADDFTEGVEYQSISPAQPTANADKIEVVGLFWYGCPHCFHLEDGLEKWAESQPEDVEFIRLPAILGPSWELLARAYYTAEFLGVLDKIHRPLFDAIHKDKQRFTNDSQVAAFFKAHGVDESEFTKTYKSFAIAAKLNRSRLMGQRYKVNGVPSLVVNGKYRTSPSMAGSNQKALEVVDYLIAKERGADNNANAAAK